MNKSSQAHQYQISHWNDDREPALLAGSIILMFATCIAVFLRILAQTTIKKGWAIDNILIVIAAVFAICLTLFNIVSIVSGLGKHQLRVVMTDPNPPQRMIWIFKSGWVIGVLQGPSLGFMKLSILFFYRRVFTKHKRTFKIAFYLLGAYTLALAVGTTAEFIFQCLPIHYFWDRSYLLAGIKPPYPIKGHCTPDRPRVAVPTIANTLSDVVIMILPAIGLWNLQIPRNKKLALFFVFSLAAFVFTIGIVRIYYSYQTSNKADITWVNKDALMWNPVECCMGIICASIPAMAPFLKSSTRQTKRKYVQNSSQTESQERPIARHRERLDSEEYQEDVLKALAPTVKANSVSTKADCGPEQYADSAPSQGPFFNEFSGGFDPIMGASVPMHQIHISKELNWRMDQGTRRFR